MCMLHHHISWCRSVLGPAGGCGEADGERKRTPAEIRRAADGEGGAAQRCSEILSHTWTPRSYVHATHTNSHHADIGVKARAAVRKANKSPLFGPIRHTELFVIFKYLRKFHNKVLPPCAGVATMSWDRFWACSVVPCASVLVTNKVSFQ